MIVFSACDITNYVALLCTQPCETCILQNILPSLRFEACWHAGFVLVQQDQNYFNEIHFLKRKKLIPSWFHGKLIWWQVDLVASWSHKNWPHESWSHGSWSHGKLILWQVDLTRVDLMKVDLMEVDLMASWSHGKLILWQVDLVASWSHKSWSHGKLIWWQVDLVASLVPRLSPRPNIFVYCRGEGRAWKRS